MGPNSAPNKAHGAYGPRRSPKPGAPINPTIYGVEGCPFYGLNHDRMPISPQWL